MNRACLRVWCGAVRTEGAGDGGRLSVVVKGRSSQPTAVVSRRQTADDYDVSFTPTETEQHSIIVLLNDVPVTGRHTWLAQV